MYEELALPTWEIERETYNLCRFKRCWFWVLFVCLECGQYWNWLKCLLIVFEFYYCFQFPLLFGFRIQKKVTKTKMTLFPSINCHLPVSRRKSTNWIDSNALGLFPSNWCVKFESFVSVQLYSYNRIKCTKLFSAPCFATQRFCARLLKRKKTCDNSLAQYRIEFRIEE